MKKIAFMMAVVLLGNILTDLWIFDFMAGGMVQQIHQVSTDADSQSLQ